jgi:hypothetical protein
VCLAVVILTNAMRMDWKKYMLKSNAERERERERDVDIVAVDLS